MTKKTTASTNPIELGAIILVFIVIVNLGALFFLTTLVKTIVLLKQQQKDLQQDLKIVNSSEQIYQKYKDNIQLILDVFPTETKVIEVLQTLETLSKNYSDDSAVKFASLSPQPEGDNLYLLFTIVLTTDAQRLSAFFDKLETLPYLTRILSVSINYPETIKGKINASMQLKLYVQNPFSSD